MLNFQSNIKHSEKFFWSYSMKHERETLILDVGSTHKDLIEKMNNQLPDDQKELLIKVDFTKPSNTYNPEYYKPKN